MIENRQAQRDESGQDREGTPGNRQSGDLHALPGEQSCGQDLPGELRDPVQVPDVVGDAEQHDQEGRAEDREDPARLGEHDLELREARGDQEGRDDSEEHRDPAEAGRRPGVDVALTDLRVEAEARAQLPDHERERERDDRGGPRHDEVEDYAHRSAPTMRTISSSGMTPWRTMRSFPSGWVSAVASTIVDPDRSAAPG